MRLRIFFKASKLPIIYRHRFMALIKDALSESDPNYKRLLYPEKDSEYSKVVKPFSFYVALPQRYTAKKEKIFVDDKTEIEDTVFHFSPESLLSFYVSSYDYQFIRNLYNGLLKMRFFEFNSEITLKFEGAYILNEEIIRTENITFRTLSPILLEYDVDGKKEPLLPLNNSEFTEFNKHFTAVHHRILRDIRTENNKKGPGLYKELEFFPLKIRKKVVKHTLHGFRELTGKPYMMLTCFEGCFDLKGDPRDLQTLYQVGIGLRTGQGFGMVEVVG